MLIPIIHHVEAIMSYMVMIMMSNGLGSYARRQENVSTTTQGVTSTHTHIALMLMSMEKWWQKMKRAA